MDKFNTKKEKIRSLIRLGQYLKKKIKTVIILCIKALEYDTSSIAKNYFDIMGSNWTMEEEYNKIQRRTSENIFVSHSNEECILNVSIELSEYKDLSDVSIDLEINALYELNVILVQNIKNVCNDKDMEIVMTIFALDSGGQIHNFESGYIMYHEKSKDYRDRLNKYLLNGYIVYRMSRYKFLTIAVIEVVVKYKD